MYTRLRCDTKQNNRHHYCGSHHRSIRHSCQRSPTLRFRNDEYIHQDWQPCHQCVCRCTSSRFGNRLYIHRFPPCFRRRTLLCSCSLGQLHRFHIAWCTRLGLLLSCRCVNICMRLKFCSLTNSHHHSPGSHHRNIPCTIRTNRAHCCRNAKCTHLD